MMQQNSKQPGGDVLAGVVRSVLLLAGSDGVKIVQDQHSRGSGLQLLQARLHLLGHRLHPLPLESDAVEAPD